MAAVHNELKDFANQIVLDELSDTNCTNQSDPVLEYITLKKKETVSFVENDQYRKLC